MREGPQAVHPPNSSTPCAQLLLLPIWTAHGPIKCAGWVHCANRCWPSGQNEKLHSPQNEGSRSSSTPPTPGRRTDDTSVVVYFITF